MAANVNRHRKTAIYFCTLRRGGRMAISVASPATEMGADWLALDRASSIYRGISPRHAGPGWREGDNYEIEQQYADGHAERLIDLATALGQSRNDVIVASGSDAVETAGKAIHSIPVVGVSATMGLGGSLARPEGNVTGIALLYDEIAAKWPELLLQIFSRARAHRRYLRPIDQQPAAIAGR